MPRRQPAILLACLLVLAGCEKAPPPPVQRTETATPRPRPTGQPLPWAPQNLTQASYDELYRLWLNRLLLDPYQARRGASEIGAHFLLRACAAAAQIPGAPSPAELQAEAALLGAALEDPVLALMAAEVEDQLERQQELLERALRRLPGSGHHPFVGYLVASQLAANGAARSVPPAFQSVLDEAALDRLREALTRAPFASTDLYALHWRLHSPASESLAERRDADWSALLAAAPGLPPWLLECEQGEQALREIAAHQREGRPIPAPLLARARAAFSSSWRRNPKYPWAAAALVRVSHLEGGGNEEMRQWFDRSLQAQMDFARAFQALRAGLWGQDTDLLALAEECRAVDRYDTTVPLEFVWTVLEIARARREAGPAFLAGPHIYDPAQQVLERYARQVNAPVTPAFARTLAVLFAYKAGRTSEAKRLFAAHGPRLDSHPALLRVADHAAVLRDLTRSAKADPDR